MNKYVNNFANLIANLIYRSIKSIDWPLMIILVLFAVVGLFVMHSAVGGAEGRFIAQSKNFVIALIVMWFVSLWTPPTIMKFVIPIYVIGCLLLLGVLLVGETSKGATRWLNIGVARIQPSEIMKIAVPLMLAWYFDKRKNDLNIVDYFIAGVLLLIPFLLIIKQPDLGTALLVFASGFFIIYFAGLSFKLIIPIALILAVGIGLIIYYEDTLCRPDFDWVILHDYQKTRVCTLLDPMSDSLGKGFHTIQGMIAIGSGGLYGKGYMKGTQTHLDFIPEQSTDFIFAVYAEEFGLFGSVFLLVMYTLLIARCFMITLNAQTHFSTLLAGSLTMILFFYVFVNMGMVMGILPIVGVPLPFMSYGGTALMTLGIAMGLMMSISKYTPPAQNN
ncbi:rod shape-determining protein RodA [Taylorella equigenitalis]|uniref:rod shape-determining protein RodA n=1 Tax=Taylorella equigenitalis TaxID=29575 RepID=UPI000414881D|nr:rod shape-determining protein RodA [Taylorella equigenitalis]WDU48030.1 rod shape-determining protein RodA [Taylorella equigenitalis]WDU53524.1 rod shape-determining protein RodA [Taylorella equigenitalis]WDU55018.1 rod shape-determining protein RodA [Taylorella equigenitalis]WEE00581.1 rod shape-determining protein RodA [Taylorella equigenitalis]WEE02058.1 rod shape-determining protein RodA [Taylorella equigenitalis]